MAGNRKSGDVCSELAGWKVVDLDSMLSLCLLNFQLSTILALFAPSREIHKSGETRNDVNTGERAMPALSLSPSLCRYPSIAVTSTT